VNLTEISLIIIGAGLVYAGVRDFRWLSYLQNFAVSQGIPNPKNFYGDTPFTGAAATPASSTTAKPSSGGVMV
jgi:hypothetical protein